MNPVQQTAPKELQPSRETPQRVQVRSPATKTNWLRSWVLINATLSGALALVWLILRSGAKPSRLAYPCQQAALGTATAALGAPLVAAALTFRKRLLLLLSTPVGRAAMGTLVLAGGVGLIAAASRNPGSGPTLADPPPGYAPEAFVVHNARGIIDGRYGGVDDLVTLMGLRGRKLYRSATVSLYSGPEGIIASDDVVLIKINQQWSQRGGTNTDVLRGLIRRIVEHPDGCPREIVVVENGQGSGSFTRTQNNAQNPAQSPQNVVNDFAAAGYPVSTWLWDTIRYNSVQEYAAGDLNDGYVVNPNPDPESSIRVSYPKFRTAGGRYVSMKRGLWDPVSQTYDNARLKFINLPVLKCHSIYGVTAMVKHHMGVVTRELSTNSHYAIRTGGLGSYMAEVRVPDLNILDCIWILARPGSGPSASYAEATRVDKLIAGFDPVALDMWAVKYVLVPAILANGYSSYPNQDPDNEIGAFRYYIDRTMSEMLAGGIPTTNDYRSVRVHTWSGDLDGDGAVDLSDFLIFQQCFGGSGNPPAPTCPPSLNADLDLDGDVDLADFLIFQQNFTGSL